MCLCFSVFSVFQCVSVCFSVFQCVSVCLCFSAANCETVQTDTVQTGKAALATKSRSGKSGKCFQLSFSLEMCLQVIQESLDNRDSSRDVWGKGQILWAVEGRGESEHLRTIPKVIQKF